MKIYKHKTYIHVVSIISIAQTTGQIIGASRVVKEIKISANKPSRRGDGVVTNIYKKRAIKVRTNKLTFNRVATELISCKQRQSDSVTNTNVSNSYENKDRNNVCVCGAEVETNSHKQKNQGSNLPSSKQKTSIPNNIDSINVHDSINCP